jgi:hypothetical protein
MLRVKRFASVAADERSNDFDRRTKAGRRRRGRSWPGMENTDALGIYGRSRAAGAAFS